jgi:hypothetical protein
MPGPVDLPSNPFRPLPTLFGPFQPTQASLTTKTSTGAAASSPAKTSRVASPPTTTPHAGGRRRPGLLRLAAASATRRCVALPNVIRSASVCLSLWSQLDYAPPPPPPIRPLARPAPTQSAPPLSGMPATDSGGNSQKPIC